MKSMLLFFGLSLLSLVIFIQAECNPGPTTTTTVAEVLLQGHLCNSYVGYGNCYSPDYYNRDSTFSAFIANTDGSRGALIDATFVPAEGMYSLRLPPLTYIEIEVNSIPETETQHIYIQTPNKEIASLNFEGNRNLVGGAGGATGCLLFIEVNNLKSGDTLTVSDFRSGSQLLTGITATAWYLVVGDSAFGETAGSFDDILTFGAHTIQFNDQTYHLNFEPDDATGDKIHTYTIFTYDAAD